MRLLRTARVAITSGPEPLPPQGEGHVWNDEVRPPTMAERRTIWSSAASWTGEMPVDGLEPLIRRFGVPIDRAADILSATSRANASFTTMDVAATAARYTMDDADGLLRAVQPRARLDDLVLAEDTRRALIDAKNRIVNRDLVFQQLGWDWMTDRLTGTYLLFAGPAGTGKTIAAEALAHELGLPVQLLEISALFSRWVGDFEEHVDKVFAAAQASGALLVANEADAILGPRTQVLHGQDRYANAGTAHILSRLEQFTGYVVFTTNLLGTNNIDPAFHRRITALVRFHQPDAAQRETLWRSVWPTTARDGTEVVLRFDLGPEGRDAYFRRLAHEHPLSGGSISSIARSATFLAAAREDDVPTVTERDLSRALAQELAKIGDFRSLTLARSRS
jgi:vesicle-fusing ATPase